MISTHLSPGRKDDFDQMYMMVCYGGEPSTSSASINTLRNKSYGIGGNTATMQRTVGGEAKSLSLTCPLTIYTGNAIVLAWRGLKLQETLDYWLTTY